MSDKKGWQISGTLLLWLIIIPIIWISCAWVSVSIQNMWALVFAVIATFIVIFLPMLSVWVET